MRRQRGSLLLYGALAAGVVIAGLTLTTTLYKNALENCRSKHEAFVAKVAAEGERAQREADAEKSRLTKAKETADANAKRLTMELNATRQRLRNERASRNLVPPAPPTSSRTDLACFDRSELGAALQRFREGIVGLVAEGDQTTVDLNAAKGWIKDVFKK